MKKDAKVSTLVLNGRVYVHGALAEEFPSQASPARPEAGTMRIHSHLDNDGRERRSRGFCASGYSGVIRASVFDGKAWRKFMLAREASYEDRSFSQFKQRPEKARIVMRVVARLKGKTCIYRDGAFAVEHEIPVAAAPAVQAKPVAPEKPATVYAGNQALLFAEPATGQSKKTVGKSCRKTATRSRRKQENPNQGRLFRVAEGVAAETH